MQKIFREIKKHPVFQNRRGLDFPPHIHDDIELVFVKRGGVTAYCDGKKYLLSENSFFLVFPNQVHHYSDCLKGEYIVIIAKPSNFFSFKDIFEDGVPNSAVWSFEKGQDDNAVQLLDIATKEFLRDGYNSIIEAYLTAIFGKLLNYYEIKKTKTHRETVLQILQYCAAHYKEAITVNSVARSLHISRSTVSHIFSSRLAMNFCDYVNSLRLIEAEQLLKNKNYSITEVSYLCGFSTIRTFNRAFLKRYGVSPSDYRKTQK